MKPSETRCERDGQTPDNIRRGILGAVVGSAIGTAAIVLLGRHGTLSALSGVVLGCCAIGGYRRGAGKLSIVGAAVCVGFMLAAVYLGSRIDFAIAAAAETGVSFPQSFWRMHELTDADAYKSRLAVLCLFAALGGVLEALGARKALRRRVDETDSGEER